MLIFDPFYGTSDIGDEIARCLNRLLLLSETVAITFLVYYQVTTGLFDWWFWPALPVAVKFGMGIINGTLRFIWNLLLVMIHGTADIKRK